MSKRSRHTDNSKRQQPVQQQRAQAAQSQGQKKNMSSPTGDASQGEKSTTNKSSR